MQNNPNKNDPLFLILWPQDFPGKGGKEVSINHIVERIIADYSTSLIASSLGTATSVSVDSMSPTIIFIFITIFSSGASNITTISYLPSV